MSLDYCELVKSWRTFAPCLVLWSHVDTKRTETTLVWGDQVLGTFTEYYLVLLCSIWGSRPLLSPCVDSADYPESSVASSAFGSYLERTPSTEWLTEDLNARCVWKLTLDEENNHIIREEFFYEQVSSSTYNTLWWSKITATIKQPSIRTAAKFELSESHNSVFVWRWKSKLTSSCCTYTYTAVTSPCRLTHFLAV